MKKIKANSQKSSELKRRIFTLSETNKVAYEYDTKSDIVVMATGTNSYMACYVRELIKKPISQEKFLESVQRWFKQNMPANRLERLILRNARMGHTETKIEELNRRMKDSDIRIVQNESVSLWCAGHHFIAPTLDEAASQALEAFGF